MKTTIAGAAAVLALALGVFPALAQTATTQTEATPERVPLVGLTAEQAKFFRYFDANEDGKITREEYRNVIVRFFEQMDRKHHGWVDDAEIRKAFPGARANRPIDPKLKMSLTQFEDFMMRRFDKADSDHTGYLPPDQFVALQNTPE
jgi:hypothetical protein